MQQTIKLPQIIKTAKSNAPKTQSRYEFPIKWNDNLNTGNDVIDQQHRHLVRLINHLHLLHLRGGGALHIKKVLAQLVDYCLKHFAFEEQLMLEAGYAQFTEHKQKHDAFAQKIKNLDLAFEKHQNDLPQFVEKLLIIATDWLIEHISHEDMIFARQSLVWL